MKKAEKIINVLVPIAFGSIAVLNNVDIINAIGGVMTLAVIGLYLYQWFTK